MPISPVPVTPVIDPTMANIDALVELGLIPDPGPPPDPNVVDEPQLDS